MARPERFDAYMERCLYGVDGFYTSGRGAAGRGGGDFITSPEVGPLFGAVLARAVDRWWNDLGRPDRLPVIDAGSGPGTLLRSLELADPPCRAAWELMAVDRAHGTEVPADLTGAIVIANELLDNLPTRIVERRSRGWAEVHVVNGAERLEPVADPGIDIEVGQRAPLIDQAASWIDEVIGRRPAKLIVFDYGATTTAELAKRGDFIRTYRDHRRGSDPLLEPGWWDITSDVPVDQLPPPSEVSTQAEFMRRWGIDDLVDEGRREWQRAAAAPDLTAIRMRSRATEASALLDPNGLGRFLALTWSP